MPPKYNDFYKSRARVYMSMLALFWQNINNNHVPRGFVSLVSHFEYENLVLLHSLIAILKYSYLFRCLV